MTDLLFAAQHGTSMAPDISVGHLLMQMVLWLGVIVGALFGLSKLAQRSKGGAGRRMGSAPRARSDQLTVVSRQSVGKGQWIAVVEAEGQRFLVGISSAGFTPLGELRADGPDDSDSPSTSTSSSSPTSSWNTSSSTNSNTSNTNSNTSNTTSSSSAIFEALLSGSKGDEQRTWLDRARAATVRR